MCRILTSIFLTIISFSLSIAQTGNFVFDGIERTYLVHLPLNYSNVEKLPLIIAMHGGFGSATNLQNQSQLSKKADQANFIVVYPEGVKGGVLNIRTWNAGWCCGYASDSDIDDIGFIDALIDTLISKYPIDESKIYATGMSNGGFMSYRLACELSERIAAIAPVAASMSMDFCEPKRTVPIISFHSYLDKNVPYYGGQGSGFSNHHNSPQDSVLNYWSSLNNCNSTNDTIIEDDRYVYIKRNNCNCGSEIHQYITKDGGHSWPGGKSTITGDDVSLYINANDLMWEFFKQYSLDCQPSNTFSSEKENIKMEIFPNPSSDVLNIESSIPSDDIHVKVYNLLGKLIYTSKNKTIVDLRNQPNGVYHITVQVKNQIISQKIVKMD